MRQDSSLARIPSAVVSAARDPSRLPESMTTFPKPCDLTDLLMFLNQACP